MNSEVNDNSTLERTMKKTTAILNNKFPFTFGSIIIDSELLNNVINEIKPETLVEWYCLTQYDIKIMKNKLENYDSKVWHQISQIPFSDDFIQTFKHKLKWKWISSHQPINEDFINEFQGYVDWNEISQAQNISESFIREF